MKNFRTPIALFILTLSLFAFNTNAFAFNADTTVKKKIEYKRDSTYKIKAAKRTTHQDKITSLEAKIRKNDRVIEDLKAKLSKLEDDNQSAESEIRGLKKQINIDNKRSKYDKRKSSIKDKKKHVYESDEVPNMKNNSKSDNIKHTEIQSLRNEIKELKESIKELKGAIKK